MFIGKAALYLLVLTTLVFSQGCNDANCKTCVTPSICTECNDRFFVLNDVCSACSDNCITCSDANLCTKCDKTYFIDIKNTCASCTTLPNCTNCSDGQSCTLCKDGFFINNKTCTACQKGCKTCTASADLCTSCQTNYVFSNYTCNPCSNAFENCNVCNDTVFPLTCISCIKGFYGNSDFSVCKTCGDLIPDCSQCDIQAPFEKVSCKVCVDDLNVSDDKYSCVEPITVLLIIILAVVFGVLVLGIGGKYFYS